MKINKLIVAFLIAQFAILNAQKIVPVMVKYEIKNESKDPVYYAIGNKQTEPTKNNFIPLSSKKSAKGGSFIKEKNTFPIFLITDSLKNDMADKIYFFPLQDLRNKTILIKIKDAPLRPDINLTYEFGDEKNNFQKRDFNIEKIRLGQLQKDPYRIITAILRGITSPQDLARLPREQFVTANSPAHYVLGFKLEADPTKLKEEDVEQKWISLTNKVRYLGKQDPEFYNQVIKIIDNAYKKLTNQRSR
ncbi:hypothetical protein M1446_00670 [Candidatus Dependentiae bacterium]|nr:hypothetical protein [Candidatus Dependentiae bacterium]